MERLLPFHFLLETSFFANYYFTLRTRLAQFFLIHIVKIAHKKLACLYIYTKIFYMVDFAHFLCYYLFVKLCL